MDDGSPRADFVSPEVVSPRQQQSESESASESKSKARQAADSFAVPSAETVAGSATVATKEKSATFNARS